MNTQRERMEGMARTPNKVERACDTLLAQLQSRREVNEEEHVALVTSIGIIEKMRRAEIRRTAGKRSAKKAANTEEPSTTPTEGSGDD